MIPGVIYRINYQAWSKDDPVTGEPTDDLQMFIDISDNDNLIADDEEPVVIPVETADDPDRQTVIDNNEDIFTVIRAQQLTLRIISSGTVSLSTFIGGSDQRWGVHKYLGTDTETIFKGFLVLGDNSISEEFLAPPNVITLTANDGLGLLKDQLLVNADGDNPTYYHKIADFLSWCLRRTGMDLDLMVVFNIKRAGDTDDISVPNANPEHFFTVEYLDSKTFEDIVGTCINMYQVIEYILGCEACLFQMQGKWWIMRIDEVEDATRGVYVTKFDSSGSFVSNLGEYDFRKDMGNGLDIKIIPLSSVTASRANKSVKLTYNYSLPKELPCNIDFSRDSLTPTVISPTENHYVLECWDKLKDATPDAASTTNIYIRRDYVLGYESARYVVIEDNADFNFIMSEAIYVNARDRFVLNVTRRMQNDVGGSGVFNDQAVQVRLYGDDGTFWTHEGRSAANDTPKWFACNSTFSTNQKWYPFEGDASEDQREAKSITDGETAEVPVAGYVKILVYQSAAFTGQDTYIDQVTFDFQPIVNGSYQKYSGQYHRTEQTGDNKAKQEREVFISDSPNKNYKGALFEFDGTNYNLAGLFYNAAVFPAGPPSSDYHHRYGEIQLFDVWNQFRTAMRTVQGTMQGLDLDKTKDLVPYPAHLINKWRLTDPTLHSLNKFFILISFDQSTSLQGWNGVLREVVDTTVAKDYSNHEFKYITA